MDKKKRKTQGKKRRYSQMTSNNIDHNQSYTDFLCPICLQIFN